MTTSGIIIAIAIIPAETPWAGTLSIWVFLPPGVGGFIGLEGTIPIVN